MDALLPAVFLLQIIAARGIDLLLKIVELPLKPRNASRLVDAVDQPLRSALFEAQPADSA